MGLAPGLGKSSYYFSIHSIIFELRIAFIKTSFLLYPNHPPLCTYHNNPQSIIIHQGLASRGPVLSLINEPNQTWALGKVESSHSFRGIQGVRLIRIPLWSNLSKIHLYFAYLPILRPLASSPRWDLLAHYFFWTWAWVIGECQIIFK